MKSTIKWFPIPGRLLPGLICWVLNHLPELTETEVWDETNILEFYRCGRCGKRGVR
jgi:hypothetical protein